MNNTNNKEIIDIKNVLTDFILEQRKFNSEQRKFNSEQRKFNSEQRKFNSEQRKFNSEQREFNISIDKKIDKVQYFLEETIADNAKMFFEEHIMLKSNIRDIESDVSGLKIDVFELTSRFRSF